VEFPLTHGHNFKRGSQAREERIGERDEWTKGVYGEGLYRCLG
jgi:hypothetical protein